MKLAIRTTRQSEDKFKAWCPALPGCAAYGRTLDEAVKKLEQAIFGYLASLDAVVPDRLEHHVAAC